LKDQIGSPSKNEIDKVLEKSDSKQFDFDQKKQEDLSKKHAGASRSIVNFNATNRL
jgi:hypothetical protein